MPLFGQYLLFKPSTEYLHTKLMGNTHYYNIVYGYRDLDNLNPSIVITHTNTKRTFLS